MFAGAYAPEGWAMCNGQLLPISGYEALFSLIGTTYGGDGVTNFALPDMRGRVPISKDVRPGSTYALGQAGGTETVTLSSTEMPKHTHAVNAQSAAGTRTAPSNGFWATAPVTAYEVPGTSMLAPMKPQSVGVAGGNQPHENMMPFLTLSFIIALSGYYPNVN